LRYSEAAAEYKNSAQDGRRHCGAYEAPRGNAGVERCAIPKLRPSIRIRLKTGDGIAARAKPRVETRWLRALLTRPHVVI